MRCLEAKTTKTNKSLAKPTMLTAWLRSVPTTNKGEFKISDVGGEIKQPTIGENEISLLKLTNGTTEIKESELIVSCVQPDVDVD